jgi:hypothetical protein
MRRYEQSTAGQARIKQFDAKLWARGQKRACNVKKG